MRVGVAVDASTELYRRKLNCLFRARREVAFFAGHLSMHSCQGILCFRMIELFGLFPVGHVVATLAVGTELPFMDVLVAGHAVLG